MAIKVTPITVSVHRADKNPVYGEGITHVSVDDDAGGAYIVLRQFDLLAENEPVSVKLDLDELEAVTQAARDLIAAQPKE